MKNRHRVLAATLACTLSPVAANAATLCVATGGAGGCFATVAAALAAAAPVGDTISIAAGTYHESRLLVNKSVDLAGAGADLTVIDGSSGGVNSPSAIVQFPSFGFVTSTISGLTVRGGSRGIDLSGTNTVTVDHARVTGNGPATGAGIFNGSSRLYVKSSLIDGNSATDPGSIAGCDWGGASGGGIASLCGGGDNYISDSAIVGNTAGRWGGGLIINDGTSVIENTTISGNAANFPDPGLAGGALFVGGAFPNITVRFSTIANNTAVGVGGIQSDEKVKLYATLLQGNSGRNCTGTPTSLGFNVSSDGSCAFAQPGDASSTDAQLQPLAMNGGPTPTHALPAASPAVDSVPEAACTVFTDQRGVSRPQHHACDAGAYERVFTAEDLGALLSGQLTGAGAGSAFVNQASHVVAAAANGQANVACNVVNAMRQGVNAQSGRRISAADAAAILRTLDDLANALGC